MWPRPKGLVSRRSILCRDRVSQGQEFYVAIEYLCVVTEVGLRQSSCVAIEYFMSRQSMAK